MDHSSPISSENTNTAFRGFSLTPSTDSKSQEDSEPEPISEPIPSPSHQPHTGLLSVSRSGDLLVADITKYLSTLPHPIEIVEELVAVSAVTSSLLLSLHTSLSRFPHLNLSSAKSFINPLCHDILFAFRLLSDRVQEAKRMRVFEPNDVGLVRLPRAAWVLVLGSEAKVAALRSRLFVEKYRVRVLIEAVVWEGLRQLGKEGRSRNEEDEWRSLKRMVPLVAERLVGVQRDYKPRLMRLAGLLVDEKLVLPEPVASGVVVKNVVVCEKAAATSEPVPVLAPAPVLETKAEVTEKSFEEKSLLKKPSSTQSLASSITAIDAPDTDIVYETWILRTNQPRKDLASRVSVLGVPLISKHTYSKKTYFTRPISSSAAETSTMLTKCHGSESPTKHMLTLRKKVWKLPEAAQREIQALAEARQAASSSGTVSRVWEVVGFMEKNRRDLAPRQRWWKKKNFVEWVLVLRGETRDFQERAVLGKNVNPWSKEDEAREVRDEPVTPSEPVKPAVPVQVKMEKPAMPVQQTGIVLRHVENRRALSIEEAEIKMQEIISDLFIQNEDIEADSEDDDEEDNEENEAEYQNKKTAVEET
ncbi:hypothetical protein WAI453_007074 [Rhynchosporium graminicola]